ncbi:MAG: GNAT family N-acetyltransferase [Culicoidibacterales bacterium]
MMIKEVCDSEEKKLITKRILDNLPEWFEQENQKEMYINNVRELPFIACFVKGEAIGFAALKATSNECAEIFVMGVLKAYHHQGIGKKLYIAVEQYAQKTGFYYLQVKTVQTGHYLEYDKTNLFYQNIGFSQLECFPTLWDKHNPYQIYVKYIGQKYTRNFEI